MSTMPHEDLLLYDSDGANALPLAGHATAIGTRLKLLAHTASVEEAEEVHRRVQPGPVRLCRFDGSEEWMVRMADPTAETWKGGADAYVSIMLEIVG